MKEFFANLGAKIAAAPLDFLKWLGIGLVCIIALSIVIKLIVWVCKR